MPSRRHGVDELPVHVVDHALQKLALVVRHRTQRVADVLVRAALHDLVGDADLLREALELAEVHDDADRAGERPGRGDDQARRGGDVVAARRGDVAERGDDRLHLAQANDLLVELLRRRDAAAGRVDPDHDRHDLRILPQGHERLDELLRVADLARELDHGDGRAEPDVHDVRAEPIHDRRQTHDCQPDADEQADSAEPGTPARHRRVGGQAFPLSRASSSSPMMSAKENLPPSRSRRR